MNPLPPDIPTDHIAALSLESHRVPGQKLKLRDRDWSKADTALQGKDVQDQLSYWREQLHCIPSWLELPTDHPRLGIKTRQSARKSLLLPQSLAEELRTFSHQENITLDMTMLAAWQTLLYRYSGQDVIVVGSSVAGQLDKETEDLIGSFVNTLALKTDLSGSPRFKDVVSQVRRITSEAYEHPDVPFEQLVEELQPARNLSHAPLFQVMFALQNAPQTGLELTGLPLPPLEVGGETAKCDLTLFLVEHAETLEATMEYNTDLFDQGTVERMLRHYQILLEGIVADPDEPIATLPLLTPPEHHQLLTAWNDTKRAYPHNQCVHQLFEAQVERTLNAIAVVYEDQQLTYGELNARANLLAHCLQRLGVGPETLVGLYVERSLEMVVGMLGILKAGGAYLPLDPNYPTERLQFMLGDAQPLVLLTQERLRGNLPLSHGAILCLDSEWDRVGHDRIANPTSGATPENLAYVIYTTGSTGKPKGVQITHHSVVNFLQSMRHEPGMTAQDVLLSVTTLSFDIAGLEIFLPLVAGAQLVVVSREVAADGERLRHAVETLAPTVMQATPVTWRMLIAAGWHGSARLKILCGGEALATDLAADLREHGAEVWNLYGPTETTIWSTVYRVNNTSSPIPIGRPIANTEIYILDRNQQPVPIGVTGELYIGGVGLARGYLNRPELTAERFIAHPLSAAPRARLYKTGDLARYRADGNIEHLGRSDQQIKLRGFRIELGEIEAALREHSGVRDATVVAQEYAPHDRRLVAYLVPDPDRTFTVQQFTSSDEEQTTQAPEVNPTQLIDDVRSMLKRRLPEYMMPAAFMLLEELPLTPNGKVDRKALPHPSINRPHVRPSSALSQTELEHYVADLWCEILKLDNVGTHDKFFEIGGNSLLGALFINKVRQKLGEMIFIVALFEAPTIAQFTTYLRTHYANAVAKAFGTNAATVGKKSESRAKSGGSETITSTDVAAMRQLIPSFEQDLNAGPIPQKNPRAIFILAPPRSGTTLLRVMLAGHPGLFAAPELQLLGFATLATRKATFIGKYNLWLEGTIRALMEVQDCGPEEAKRVMEEYEDRNYSTKEFFRLLQEQIAPRVLVDKTPSYVLDPIALQRAEAYFDQPLYIHLVRHPYATIRSFESFHLNQVLLTREHNYTSQQFAELVWTVSHQNICEFLAHVPTERQYRMKFEDLTNHPQNVMEEMCAALGLSYHPDLIQPYKDPEKKMTDGIYTGSTPMGDTKFHEYRGIDPTVAETWRKVSQDNFLSVVTWDVAETLGYDRPTTQTQTTKEDLLTSSEGTLSNRHTLLQRQREVRQSRRATRTER